jgi:hypothetical protein
MKFLVSLCRKLISLLITFIVTLCFILSLSKKFHVSVSFDHDIIDF